MSEPLDPSQVPDSAEVEYQGVKLSKRDAEEAERLARELRRRPAWASMPLSRLRWYAAKIALLMANPMTLAKGMEEFAKLSGITMRQREEEQIQSARALMGPMIEGARYRIVRRQGADETPPALPPSSEAS